MAMSAGENISAVKLGRITQQSISMLRNIKKFFNVQFKIEECHDDVFESDSDEEDQNGEEGEVEKAEDKFDENEPKPQFASTFIYSCIGVGLQNFARKIE